MDIHSNLKASKCFRKKNSNLKSLKNENQVIVHFALRLQDLFYCETYHKSFQTFSDFNKVMLPN